MDAITALEDMTYVPELEFSIIIWNIHLRFEHEFESIAVRLKTKLGIWGQQSRTELTTAEPYTASNIEVNIPDLLGPADTNRAHDAKNQCGRSADMKCTDAGQIDRRRKLLLYRMESLKTAE